MKNLFYLLCILFLLSGCATKEDLKIMADTQLLPAISEVKAESEEAKQISHLSSNKINQLSTELSSFRRQLSYENYSKHVELMTKFRMILSEQKALHLMTLEAIGSTDIQTKEYIKKSQKELYDFIEDTKTLVGKELISFRNKIYAADAPARQRLKEVINGIEELKSQQKKSDTDLSAEIDILKKEYNKLKVLTDDMSDVVKSAEKQEKVLVQGINIYQVSLFSDNNEFNATVAK